MQRCDQQPVDAGVEASPDAGDGSPGPVCSGVTGGEEGCPPLLLPECDARLADACPEQACSSGCEAFLRCSGGDWGDAYEAYCSEDGSLVKN